jgi:glutamate-ammonia-ligase adenylyltransferase
VVERLLALLESIDRREAYYSLLVEFPQVLDRAAALVARSRWAAGLLARSPDPAGRAHAHRRGLRRHRLDGRTRGARRGSARPSVATWRRLLDHLRHYKQRQVLRFTIADLEGELPVMALSDELSALADTILDVTLAEALKNVGVEGLGPGPHPGAGRRGGDASSAGRPHRGFCIVGYGKLGGKELGYGSDLDVSSSTTSRSRGQAERSRARRSG